mgnify:CR=1 FL=1
MMERDDNELVMQTLNGNRFTFGMLIDRYQQTIFNIMLRLTGDYETARDLTQDVFIKAWEKLGSFKCKYRFYSWIYRIAINEAINFNRKKKSIKPVEKPLTANEEFEENSDEYHEMTLLYAEIQQLKMDYRVLVVLKYFCDLSYEEMAEVTKTSVKKVRSRLFSARELMRLGLMQKNFFDND